MEIDDTTRYKWSKDGDKVYNTGRIVVFIDGHGEHELGIVVIQYDNYDTEVMFTGGYQALVDCEDVIDGYLIPLEVICK